MSNYSVIYTVDFPQSATYVSGYIVGFNFVEGYEGFVIYLSTILWQFFLDTLSNSIFC